MRLTSKGQVTIPIHVREQLGLLPGSEVDFIVEGETARLIKTPGGKSRGREIVEHMRRHRGDADMTTDEIMALTRGDD